MRVCVLVLLMTIFSGCATGYKPKSFSAGYSDMQLNETTFQIIFHGNYYTGLERASDFALLRSAEVVVANGFRYFIIVDSENTYTTGSGNLFVGNYAYRSVPTRSYAREFYSNGAPTTANTIYCFKEKPEMNELAFDAEYLMKSIKQKYKIAN